MNFFNYGFKIINDYLKPPKIESIISEIEEVDLPMGKGGIRCAEKKLFTIKNLVSSNLLVKSAKEYLKRNPQLVRVILFNKTETNNWLVPWHQDRTVAVSKKFNLTGWGPWSLKEGIHHVQPPVEVLNQMIIFRIHLDGADEENGCLKVFPGSHFGGIMSKEMIQKYTKDRVNIPYVCHANAGSLITMHPLVLHSSSKATFPSQRRVLLIEYCDFELTSGVAWG